MSVAPELINLVLQEFQNVLRENLNFEWGPQDGCAPHYGYVEHTEWADDELKKAPAISAWHISISLIRSTSVKTLPAPKVDGIFFDLLKGWFYLSPDQSTVSINWQTGPRFGRGFKHRIGKDTFGKYLLDRGTNTWMS